MFWLAEVFNGSFSQEELKRAEQWAHRERAEMTHKVFVGAPLAAFRGLASRLKARHERKRAARSLRHLDDHLLRDIGLKREDVHLIDRGRWPEHHPDALGELGGHGTDKPIIEDGRRTRIDRYQSTWKQAA